MTSGKYVPDFMVTLMTFLIPDDIDFGDVLEKTGAGLHLLRQRTHGQMYY